MEKQNKSEQGEGKAQGLPQEADILTSEARSCGRLSAAKR